MSTTRRKIAPGELLIRQGDPSPDEAFMILSGKCEVFVNRGGQRQHIAYVLPHQIVGEIALIDNFPRTASVVAVEATETEVMDRTTFQMCMKDSNPFVVALLRVLSSRYRSLVSKLGVTQL